MSLEIHAPFGVQCWRELRRTICSCRQLSSCLLYFHLFFFWGQGAGSSCPPPPSEINVSEIYFVKLVKEDGTLGFSVTVRIINQAWEVHG